MRNFRPTTALYTATGIFCGIYTYTSWNDSRCTVGSVGHPGASHACPILFIKLVPNEVSEYCFGNRGMLWYILVMVLTRFSTYNIDHTLSFNLFEEFTWGRGYRGIAQICSLWILKTVFDVTYPIKHESLLLNCTLLHIDIILSTIYLLFTWLINT